MEIKTTITNRFDAPCYRCGERVPQGVGRAELDTFNKWHTRHNDDHVDCQRKVAAKAAGAVPTKTGGTIAPEDEAVSTVISLMAGKLASDLVPQLVAENMAALCRTVEIKIPKMPTVKVETAHYMLPVILQAVVAGASPFIVGPAGSGKTTLAEQICTVLGRSFYMAARVTSEYKLIGFTDAHGNTIRTQFREAYEHGGGFLFDEVDASDADAMTSFNAALSNGYCDFPDGMVRQHKDFFAIAAGNTFGKGADRQYVGRNQLDAATLDRFQIFEVDYDEQLELALAGDAVWARRVQKVRSAVLAEKVRHIVSPRASIVGAKLLAAGMAQGVVEESCIWKGLDTANRIRVEARIGRTDNA